MSPPSPTVLWIALVVGSYHILFSDPGVDHRLKERIDALESTVSRLKKVLPNNSNPPTRSKNGV